MNYRVTCNLFVADGELVRLVRDYLRGKMGEVVNIHQGEETEELSWVRVEKCYHDETPVLPCEIVGEWVKQNS